jgi:hypothetical protein
MLRNIIYVVLWDENQIQNSKDNLFFDNYIKKEGILTRLKNEGLK